MLIYRVEKDGVGPFHWLDENSDETLLDFNDSILEQGYKYPTIYEDFKRGANYYNPKQHKNFYCGCIDFNQVLFWFDWNILDYMNTIGFKINIYDVPESAIVMGLSKKQLFFDKKRAKLLQSNSVYDFIENF